MHPENLAKIRCAANSCVSRFCCLKRVDCCQFLHLAAARAGLGQIFFVPLSGQT